MDSKTRIRLFFALEVFIWLFVIALCIGFVRYHNIKKHNSLTTYSIFMQDVDGLIEGSSVRMMGVPIGYIKSINIVQDQVYVKFVLTDGDIDIPQGAIVTVEFNGMAGSKSLEIYPPDEVSKASGKLITIKRTNRLGAALGLFDDMFAKFDSIIVRCNHFSGHVKQMLPMNSADLVRESSVDAEKSLGLINNFIKNLDDRRLELRKFIHPQENNVIQLNQENIEDQTVGNGN